MPRKVFVAGEILTAADVNTNLMDQAVMSFAGTAARGSAIPSPTEGMVSYLADSDRLEIYTNVWEPLAVGIGPNVVQTVKTDTFSTTSTSYTQVTGMTATITPSSTTSKMLIICQAEIGTGVFAAYIRLAGGNTASYIAGAASNRIQSVSYLGTVDNSNFAIQKTVSSHTIVYLDSPATTSAVTYSLEMRRDGNTSEPAYLNRSHEDGDFNYYGRSASSITVMEVAG